MAVRPEDVDRAWIAVGPLIERALARGQGDETTSEAVRERVRSMESQCWVVVAELEVKAAAILSVMQTENVRKLLIEILTGKDMPAWVDQLEAQMVRFMKQQDCTCIEASCRPGLARLLKKRDWQQKAVIMELKNV